MTFRMKDTDLEAELKTLFADLDADGDGAIGAKDADKVRPSVRCGPAPTRVDARGCFIRAPRAIGVPHPL